MILAVTLNPSIDVIYVSPTLKIRRVNRVKTFVRNAGGKGINSALALNALGVEVIAMGFIGGVNGRYVEEYLRDREVTTNFVYVDDETRVNHVIINRNNRFQTQILEDGPIVNDQNLKDFIDRYERTLTHSEIVIIGGSVPRNVNVNIYRQLVEIAQKHDVKTVIYASGEAFEEAVKQGPNFVMPDLQAVEKILGKKINTENRKISVAQNIFKYGVEAVFYGPENLDYLIVKPDCIWKVNAPSIETVSTVGTGDAFIGYLVDKLYRNETLKQAVRSGVAASTSCATKIEKEMVDPKEVDKYISEVLIKEVE